MRRFPIELFIVVVAIMMLILGWRIYGPGEMGRFAPAIHAQKAPSELYARMLIRYPSRRSIEEEYACPMSRASRTFAIAIRGWNGHEITVSAPPARVYDVSFFFGRLDQDGIWQLDDKPPRPGAVAHYTVYVKQLADYQHGETNRDVHRSAVLGDQTGARSIRSTSPRACRKISCTWRSRRSRIRATWRSSTIFATSVPTSFKANVAKAQARIRGSHG